MRKRIPWFEIILIVVVMATSLYAALSDGQNLTWRWFVRDDAYYYFKVAQNISEGHGSTFDGINKTNGYHPLWMIICIPIFALARFDLILPLRILLVLLSGLSVATGILLYRLLGRIFAPAIGAFAALYWVFDTKINAVIYRQGLETGIAAFFIVLLLYKLYQFELSWRENKTTRKQIIVIAVIAVLTMFSRLDLVFLAGMVGLWVVFRDNLLRYFLPLDITAITVISLLSFLIRIPLMDYYDYTSLAIVLLGVSLVVKLVCAFMFGLYQKSVLSNPVDTLKRVLAFAITSSAIVGALMLASLQIGILQGSFSRMILLIDLALTAAVFLLNRLVFTSLLTKSTSTVKSETPVSFFLSRWKQWLYDGSIYYGIVLGALGVYMVWNKLAFGTASPVSGQIKRWWATLPGRAYGGATRDTLSFFGLTYTGDANAWNPISSIVGGWAESFRLWGLLDIWRYFLLLVLLAVVFYLILFLNRKKAKTALTQLAVVPLFFSSWLQVLSYHALGYSAYKDWYWVTQLVFVVLVFSFAIGMFVNVLRNIPYAQLLSWGVVVYIGITMGMTYWRVIRMNMPYNAWAPDAPYMDIVPLLEANTEPGSIIGMTGGGNPGYFIHDRTVVNMDGLINSYPYFHALQNQEAGEFLYEMGMDYVFANPYILDRQPYKGQYNEYMDTTNIRYGGKLLFHYDKP